MFAAGDNRDYPVQVYSGTQGFLAASPAQKDEPEYRKSTELVCDVLGAVVAIIGDTIVLPITIPLTVVNVFTPPANRAHFALARY